MASSALCTSCNRHLIFSGKSPGGSGVCTSCGVHFPSGLITHDAEMLCPLCDISLYHIGDGGGSMIWLPSISQQSLNVMMLMIFCGIYACDKDYVDGELKDRIRENFTLFFESAKALSSTLQNIYLGDTAKVFPSGASPLWFAQMMEEAGDGASMGGVRYLPGYASFVKVLTPFFEDFISSNPVASWVDTSFLEDVNDEVVDYDFQ